MPTKSAPSTSGGQPPRRRSARFPIWFAATEGARAALGSIRAHGFRSFLTALGIVIGVASVIAMVSIIQGLSQLIGQQFEGLGSNSITVQAYTSFEDQIQGQFNRLTPNDLDLIRYRVQGIDSITPIIGGSGTVRYGAQSAVTRAIGSTYSYQDIGQFYAAKGRFISASDDDTRRRVAVIGEQVRTDLALGDDPIGEFIQYNGAWLKIIGLLEPKGEILGQNQDSIVIVPYSTMVTLQPNRARPNIAITMTIADLDNLENVRQTIARLLRNAHNLEEEDDDDFQIQTAEQLQESINTILDTATVVMGGIVGISLLVGGIGIMNIMLVSVTERTREIGICKAIGAKRHHILLQFLLEALVLCLLGGFVGLAIGYGIGALVAGLIPGFPEAYTPLWAVGLALGFSGLVGVVFGILPAAKAANLDPISSLRYE